MAWSNPQDKSFLIKTFLIMAFGFLLAVGFFFVISSVPDSVYLRFENLSGQQASIQFIGNDREVIQKLELQREAVVEVEDMLGYQIKN
jgi:hypothetical protein